MNFNHSGIPSTITPLSLMATENRLYVQQKPSSTKEYHKRFSLVQCHCHNHQRREDLYWNRKKWMNLDVVEPDDAGDRRFIEVHKHKAKLFLFLLIYLIFFMLLFVFVFKVCPWNLVCCVYIFRCVFALTNWKDDTVFNCLFLSNIKLKLFLND